MPRIFVAVAMEHQQPTQVYVDGKPYLQRSVVEDLIYQIEKQYGDMVFYAPRIWPTEADFIPPTEALEAVDKALQASEIFLLYYPTKVVSGALVELGMALGYGKPILIYTQHVSNITYMLRDNLPHRNVQLTTRVEDIWPWIQTQLTP